MNTPSPSFKVFSIRALYDWIVSLNQSPNLVVRTDFPGVRAPTQFASQANRMRFNISSKCVQGLSINVETGVISFYASFSGVHTSVSFPAEAVESCFSGETKEGIEFEVANHAPIDPAHLARKGRPALSVVVSN
ncbi:ClpXP protease specificity-enhancing factor SspB [Pseudomonas taiwanensis]|uniref:ClpXP protease specificity-enhancing factor SspB n=1 Tax=Pseudomonas taiwanensis TaxID=470150 RepID=UPI0028DD7427|nr:ClpXP protease specificity-enhancing factor SspB [Pseudomonas taiwanensis]MDT8925423.1 ClpXP protease specificity-enhancing factor SspB [Pseudomonas taiwanensis]